MSVPPAIALQVRARRRAVPRRHAGEGGFALLLVFLMAAAIGITLWAELPRVAIQSQRAKEQMLMERGEQFKRAIQLYVRANKGTRYPADIDDLDRGYNNLRFLRHRYKDPLTGKDEWRIIHMVGGVLTDSLLSKPKSGDKPESNTLGQNLSALAGLGDVPNSGPAVPNALSRRRQSEGGTGGSVGPDGQPIQPADTSNPQQPGAGPAAGLFQPGAAPSGAVLPPGVAGAPGGPTMPFAPGAGPGGGPGTPGATPQFPGQPPGMPGQFGIPGPTGLTGATPGQNPANTGYGSTVGDYSGVGTGTGAQPSTPGAGALNEIGRAHV